MSTVSYAVEIYNNAKRILSYCIIYYDKITIILICNNISQNFFGRAY